MGPRIRAADLSRLQPLLDEAIRLSAKQMQTPRAQEVMQVNWLSERDWERWFLAEVGRTTADIWAAFRATDRRN